MAQGIGQNAIGTIVGGEVRVFDSKSGVRVGTLASPDLIWALGVAIRRN